MSVAALNGHSRRGALSADELVGGTVQADVLDVASIDATSATFNFLTIQTAASFSGIATVANATFAQPAIFTGAVTFSDNVTVSAGHAVALDSATTLAAGGSVSAGQVLVLTGATLSGGPVFSGGAAVPAGQTLALAGVSVLGNPTFSNGASLSSGQTLAFVAGATIAGSATFTGGCVLAAGRTLTYTGATLNGGGTGVMTGVFTLNGFRANTVIGRRYAAPVPIPAGLVFPTLRPPANPLGVFVIDATSFSGEASNGANSGGVRGANFTTTAARATAVDNTDCALQDFVVFNRSPFSFYLLNNTFQNMGEMSPVIQIQYPLTEVRCSRAAFPGGASTLWKATAQPLKYVSGWASLNPALLTSADCVPTLYRHQYAVTGACGGGGRTAIELTGQLLIHFTIAGPTDPVRIQVPLPVGAAGEVAYPAVSGFTPRCGIFRDWVVSATNMFPESATAFVGPGELSRALGTYAFSDPVANVGAYVENGDPNAGYLRVVVSEFSLGAGTYKLRCNYRVPLEALVYRATYDTFSYVV